MLFEFQSHDGGVEDLKRFRQYEANVSSAYGVVVVTYVVYTGNVKNPVTSITEGINTYRIVPILMGEKNGDQVIKTVWEKLKAARRITKQDLVPLVMTPLMSGKDSIAVRMKEILTLLSECEKKVNEELEEVVEVLKMSILGQRIFEDGVEKGIEKGIERGMEKSMTKIVTTMLSKNKTVEEIHEDTDIPIRYIQAVKDSLS